MLARVLPTNETPEAKVDRLCESLVLPPKPNLLKLAESGVEQVRTKRAELKADIHAAVLSGGSENKGLVQKLTAELEALELGAGRKAFEERTRRREEFSKSAMAKLGSAVAQYRQEMNRLIDEMEALNSAAVELMATSNANGIEPLSGVRASLPVANQIRHLRQTISNNGSMYL
ncbi:hypothetical protein X727_23095 [Mesorhizobium sp. L103C119B0]|uniref:hypothetical protein n=1 Tax=Mesorhizobium sp. L103C119B0 TaxID=1287085 RepID=UPI0003D040F3|nr:hypothetical protein [Mesorhizobium sp. L103C119B0]ESZ68169.1 hypothetical protein X727_23095 [Mesorhizobium sp. L103C119B0]